MRSAVPESGLPIFALESAGEHRFSDAVHRDAMEQSDCHGQEAAAVHQAIANEPIVVALPVSDGSAVVVVVVAVVDLAEQQIAARNCFDTRPVVENWQNSRRLIESDGLFARK